MKFHAPSFKIGKHRVELRFFRVKIWLMFSSAVHVLKTLGLYGEVKTSGQRLQNGPSGTREQRTSLRSTWLSGQIPSVTGQ